MFFLEKNRVTSKPEGRELSAGMLAAVKRAYSPPARPLPGGKEVVVGQ